MKYAHLRIHLDSFLFQWLEAYPLIDTRYEPIFIWNLSFYEHKYEQKHIYSMLSLPISNGVVGRVTFWSCTSS